MSAAARNIPTQAGKSPGDGINSFRAAFKGGWPGIQLGANAGGLMKLISTWHLTKHAAIDWWADTVPRYGASLAFYTFFSMTPLLTITIAISSLFFGRDAVEGRIYSELAELVGPEAAAAIQALVRNAWRPGKDLWAMGLALVILLVGAIGVLNELRGALNAIWKVRGPSSVRIVVLSQTRLLGFLLGVGFLLVVSLIFGAVVSAMGQVYRSWLTWPGALLHTVDFLFEWVLTILIFAAIFKWLPDARVAWRDVWTGAGVTALLFLAGKSLLGLYLGRSGISSLYGAAGSLSVVLLWVYYSALIFYFGAEFTKVYANSFGSHVKGR
jgi:membrane protein